MTTLARSLILSSTLVALGLGCSSASDSPSATSGSTTGQGGASTDAATSTGAGASGVGAGSSSAGSTSSTGSGTPETPPSVFVAPDGDDANPCTDDSPCLTLARGYEVAEDGETILVRAGGYAEQKVAENGGGTKAVTFWGEPGAKMKQLQNWADNVTFDGLEVDCELTTPNGAGMENHGSNGVTFKNGTIGNIVDEKGALISGENFTFDNVLFHDANLVTEGVHMECVYAIVVPGMKILNSTFRDCAVMDVFFTYGDWWDPLPPAYGNVTIENNVFAHSEMDDGIGWHYYSLLVGNLGPPGSNTPMDGWVVRNNTFEINGTFEHDVVSSRWVNNIGAWDCQPGMVYSHNVGESCGPTDKAVSPPSSSEGVTAPFGWKDPANVDFHLTAGSPAIDAGDPSDFPPLDREGKPRGAAPEAGAYEF